MQYLRFNILTVDQSEDDPTAFLQDTQIQAQNPTYSTHRSPNTDSEINISYCSEFTINFLVDMWNMFFVLNSTPTETTLKCHIKALDEHIRRRSKAAHSSKTGETM